MDILVIKSDIQNIGKVENFIEILQKKYRIPDKVYANIHLAILEAAKNAISHGNRCDPAKEVVLTFTKRGRMFTATIEDQGVGFDYKNIPDPTDLNDLSGDSGRGVYIMSQLADIITFDNNGAKVTISFKNQKRNLWSCFQRLV